MPVPAVAPSSDSLTSDATSLAASQVSRSNDLSAALDALTRALKAPIDLSRPTPLASARTASLGVAIALNQLERPPAQHSLKEALLGAATLLAAHPAAAYPVDTATLDTARTLTGTGWVGNLAHVFAAPSWQMPQLRPLADQAPWLWPAYARYLFATPACFQTSDQENRWANHIVTHLEPLARMLECNRGSSALVAVGHIVATAAAHWPAVGGADLLNRRQQALGRLLTSLAPRLAPYQPTSATNETGRLLRVGVMVEPSAFGGGIFEANRLKTHLDPQRVELTVYTLEDLPRDVSSQVSTLRTAQLDAVIFAADLTQPAGPFTQLALHRVATRQFATALSPHTTGLPEIDIFLTDSTVSPAAHTERLGVLPASLAFERATEESTLTRVDFDLPVDARLLVATVHPAHCPVATRTHWKDLLDADANARLLLLPDTVGLPLDLLFSDLQRELGERLILAGNVPLESPAVAALLRVSDAYLPSEAPGSALHAHIAHQLGLPVNNARPQVDCLAFADAITSLLEIACLAPGQPLVAVCPPTDVASRQARALDLTLAGRPDRAALYLLAAVEDPDAGPEIWHDLALALHASGQTSDAIQALETCVRLAPDRLDTWLQLAEWAWMYGHQELIHDILEVVKTLAPADPRVIALVERTAV
jgi:hypothetical protein